ncbi:DNA helicase RecQ [Bacillus sp. 2205SS5-2]|uniref:DNA helicase RecQ n=1 Tax=Bacillus sp. 2205SS5-2 TaxID=3109031 RepID=UPI0030072F55
MNFTIAQEYLKKYYGYDSFRDGQEEAIKMVLKGEKATVIMPTGGGKSLCYQIPSLMFEGTTVVISPLISLMKDQVDALIAMGIPSTFINSTLSARETKERIHNLKQGEYKLIYIAPERLEIPSFLQELEEVNIPLVAIDEAHCISQWGHDFRPSYMKIKTLLSQLTQTPRIIALTATATEEVRKDICDQLNIPIQNCLITGFQRPNLAFSVIKDQDRDRFLMEFTKKNQLESGIIYCATRKETERLHKKLQQQGINCGKYHGGLSHQERKEMQEEFLQDETLVMVATNAFGMGINKSNVRYVIHYQMPRNMESYYQEAGRAGRDGEDSQCYLLFSPQDIQIQRFLIDSSLSQEQLKNAELKKLQYMIDYCHTENCLHTFIMNYFGEEDHPACGSCGNCQDNREQVEITKEAQMVLSCMLRMGERFGNTMIAHVLTGSKNKKISTFGFQSLSTYGLMKGRPQKEVSRLIDYFISQGLIEVIAGKLPILKVTNSGKKVLKGEKKIYRKEALKAKEITVNDDLFENLRHLRKKLAEQEGVPPFVIFSDKTLRELSSNQPTDLEKFLDIKGVGIQKQEKYGNLFIQCIVEYQNRESFV